MDASIQDRGVRFFIQGSSNKMGLFLEVNGDVARCNGDAAAVLEYVAQPGAICRPPRSQPERDSRMDCEIRDHFEPYVDRLALL